MQELITIQPKNNTTPDWSRPFNFNGSLWQAFDADVGFSMTVPEGTRKIVINSTEPLWVSPEAIAAGPIIGAPISGTFELNIPVLAVPQDFTTLYGFSRTAGDVTLNFYTG